MEFSFQSIGPRGDRLGSLPYLDTFIYTPVKYVGNGPGFNDNILKNPIPDVPIDIAQINHPRGLAADYLGNLYFADEYNGSVRVVIPNADGEWVVRTIVGTGVEAGSAEPPNGVLAQGIEMYEPMAVDVAAYCRYVVFLNTDSHLVQMLDMEHPAGVYERDIYYRGSLLHAAGQPYPAGPWLTTIAGEYIAGSAGGYYEPPDHDPMKARFNNPQGVAITDDANTIYVADTENNVIRLLTRTAQGAWQIFPFAGSPSAAAGYGGDGGPALNALLDQPVGIALDDAEENLYIADMNNQRVRRIDLATGIITTVAGNGVIPPNQFTNVNDGTVAQLGAPLNQVALFKYLSDVALDANGNLYIADQGNNRIRKILADLSEIQTIYGDGTPNLIQAPRGVEVNWAGEVFASDTEGAKIWKLTPDGLTPENYPPAPPCLQAATAVNLSANKFAVNADLPLGRFEFGVFDQGGNLVASALNGVNGEVIFQAIALTAPDIYAYTIREISPDGDGWETDASEYPAIITVAMSEEGTLIASVSYPQGPPVFTNTFVSEPPVPATARLRALKTVYGACLSANQFVFGVFDASGNEAARASNNGNGQITFPALSFDQAGAYPYTIRELNASGNGWVTDTRIFSAIITVAVSEQGQLIATVNYPGGFPAFVNRYCQQACRCRPRCCRFRG